MPSKSFKPTIPNSQDQVTSSNLSYRILSSLGSNEYMQCDQDLCGYLWTGLFN